MCAADDECNCEIAVRRVYRELRVRNFADLAAFDTATRVYRQHHPEVPVSDARYIIAEWLDETP